METKKLIKLIKGTVDNNTVLPVLENVKIENNILTATDLETTLEIHDIGIKGKGLIYSNDFISAIETIKDYKIEIKDKARIFNETESVELANPDIKDFPKKPDVSKSKEIGIIDAEDFKKILIAQDFVSNDDLRPALMCVHVGKDIVATNAHYMYFEKVSEPVKQSCLLPSKVVKLMKIMNEFCIVNATEDHIIIKFIKEFCKVTITFRKLDKRFPDYQSVIPTNHSTTIEVDKKEFTERINKAIKFTDKATFKVAITINNFLFVEGFDFDWDKSYKSDLPIDKTGENVYSEFNGKFMLKILSKIKAEKITLKFTGANKAILIEDNFILMPIMQT